MKKTFILFLLVSLLLIGKSSEHFIQKDGNAKKHSFLSIFKKKIETEHTDSLSVENFLVLNPDFTEHRSKLLKFYSGRNFRLAWSEEGEFLPQATMFINLVNDIHSHGIHSNFNYSMKEKYKLISEARRPHKDEISIMRKNLDLLLTAAYFKYSQEIWGGIIDPQEDHIEWNITRKKIKYDKTLEAILSNNQSENPFQDYEPLHQEYQKLKDLLAKYSQISQNGGWPQIQLSTHMKKGQRDSIVQLLRERLYISGDLPTLTNKSEFDEELAYGVKNFQRRHGLKEDGIVAGKTLEAMNVTVQERINQIIINMERWRWVPEKISSNYVMVNIPEYKLHIFENDTEIWSMNVIVGKSASQTPIFNSDIEYVVINPSWTIPEQIGIDEIVPFAKRDSTFLRRYNIEVSLDNLPLNSDSIQWNAISEEDIRRYRFKQKPGGYNPLGKIKFLFPNEYDVYLHDTPSSRLFEREDRNFSHGCIRIQDPIKFADYLLRNDSIWTHDNFTTALNSGEEVTIKLQQKVPVYIVYFTVWVDENGVANFREDIYGHDKKLARAFYEK